MYMTVRVSIYQLNLILVLKYASIIITDPENKNNTNGKFNKTQNTQLILLVRFYFQWSVFNDKLRHVKKHFLTKILENKVKIYS